MKFTFAAKRINWPTWPPGLFTAVRPHNWPIISVSLAILSAVLIPVNLLAGQPFHHDEALYATWALQIVSGADPWLAHTPVDKPPLFLYTLAGAMTLLDATESAARIPSLLATALTVGLTFGLGRKLYGDGVGLVAAWLVALSPFTLLFAPTAFTDPLLVTLALASCLAAAHNRPGWAGVALGLAIATKQQGVFFIPLVVGLLRVEFRVQSSEFRVHAPRITHHASRITHHLSRITHHVSHIPHHVSRLLLAMGSTLLPVLFWDLARGHVAGFLTRSLINYGGLVNDTAGFGERGLGFVELLQYGTASPTLNLIFVAGLPFLLIYTGATARLLDKKRKATGQRHLATPPFSPGDHPLSRQLIRASHADWILVSFILVFLLGHALFSFQIWDRYLLGLIPLLALLLARVLLLPWSILNHYWLDTRPYLRSPAGLAIGLVLVSLLALTLARPVRDAANARYPLGSNSSALQGIEQIVAYLRGHAGANHTLYHRWLGPHWRFYLWNYPYDLQYWSSPQDLAARARPGHLIAFPAWRSDTEARLALAEAGLELQEVARAYHPAGYPSLILYRIEVIVGSKSH